MKLVMLHAISDSELISKTKSLAAEERRLLAQVLLHLEEIERRKLYLDLGHSSLFAFCCDELGYSRNEAYARIAAMRVSREVPEVMQAVESGRLSLTNLTIAHTYFKQEAPSAEVKREVLKEIEGLSTRECEKRLMPEARIRKVFELDDDLANDLRRIRELWGNLDLDDTELLRKMAKLVLSRIDPETRVESKRAVGAPKLRTGADGGTGADGDGAAETPPPEFVTPATRHIPTQVRREVWRRDRGQCTYEGCASRYALQFDHVIPYAHGGSHTASNLRLLCRAHHHHRRRGPPLQRY